MYTSSRLRSESHFLMHGGPLALDRGFFLLPVIEHPSVDPSLRGTTVALSSMAASCLVDLGLRELEGRGNEQVVGNDGHLEDSSSLALISGLEAEGG